MNHIFISYRREDSEGFARGVFQSLAGTFGQGQVFMDVETIGLGTDFVEAIDKSLARCGALIVLVGRDWLTCQDANGGRRLDNPHDFVRMEVAKALEKNIFVIPVLVKGVKMPPTDALPEDLRPLTRRHALELRHERWSQDVDQLVTELATLLKLERKDQPAPPAPPQPAGKNARRWKTGLAAALVVVSLLIAAGIVLLREPPPPVASVERKVQAVTANEPAGPIRSRTASPPREGGTSAVPAPQSPTRPAPSRSISLAGSWVDADGIGVQFSQQGSEVVSQAYDPMSGLTINAVWRISGQQVTFSWMSNAGSQGIGEGTVTSDGNIIDYRYVDHVTGEQGYSRLFRDVR